MILHERLIEKQDIGLLKYYCCQFSLCVFTGPIHASLLYERQRTSYVLLPTDMLTVLLIPQHKAAKSSQQ